MTILKPKPLLRAISVKVPKELLDEFEALRAKARETNRTISITDIVVDALKKAVVEAREELSIPKKKGKD